MARSVATRRLTRLLPIARVLAIAQLALLAKRHLDRLTPKERRRLVELVRKGRSLSTRERRELRALTARLQPKAFAWSAVDHMSPVPLPDRLTKPSSP
jgi:tellurite resistance protein